MIRRIIEFAATNRMLMILLVGAAVAYAWYAMQNIPLDAIPDLSDTQVIIYSRWDRSPDIIEDQVTYPIVTALLGAPKIKAIRVFRFGFLRLRSQTDGHHWARSRVLIPSRYRHLPAGVKPAGARRHRSRSC
jgi:Cu(I)/Ag(I) efflux system membrane protein CusA/SilA